MSQRFGSSLISGAQVYGSAGLGITGAELLAGSTGTGANGPGVLYPCVDPGDEAKEFSYRIISPPSGGTFTAREDGSWSLVNPADGDRSWTMQLVVDGVNVGSVITQSVTVGSGSASVAATMSATGTIAAAFAGSASVGGSGISAVMAAVASISAQASMSATVSSPGLSATMAANAPVSASFSGSASILAPAVQAVLDAQNGLASPTFHGAAQVFDPAPPVILAPSALFPNPVAALAALRRDNLMLAAGRGVPSVTLSDEYLWSKIIAAESATARDLRVHLQPTVIIPDDAPQSEVDALEAAGTPYAQEPAYDYESAFFRGEKWGYMVARNKPIISVQSLRFVYPTNLQQVFEVPLDWLRFDKHSSHIRLVPTSTSFAAPLAAFALQVMGGGHIIPFMIQLRYTAGLKDAAKNWPELVDVVKKRAVLEIINDAFLPSSSSISADGLSQSLSIDALHYQEMIDHKLYGGRGCNGGLMTAIHGIRFGVLGSVN